MSKHLNWLFQEGKKGVQADITYSGDYVVSHRPMQFNLCFRPPGEHHHLGCFQTLEKAKEVAQQHAEVMEMEFSENKQLTDVTS